MRRRWVFALVCALGWVGAYSAVAQPDFKGWPDLEPFCDRPQHFDFSWISPAAESAARRCRATAPARRGAACGVLQGYRAMGAENSEEALRHLRASGRDFAAASDLLGEWIALQLEAEILHAEGSARETDTALAQALVRIARLESGGAPGARSQELLLQITGIPSSLVAELEAAGQDAWPVLLRTARASTLALLAVSQACAGSLEKAAATGGRVAALSESGLVLRLDSRDREFDGWLHERRGKSDRALAEYARAFELALDEERPKRVAAIALRRSRLSVRTGRAREALAVLEEAVGHCSSALRLQALLLSEKALVHAVAGDTEALPAAVTRARQTARADGGELFEAMILNMLGGRLGELGFVEDQIALLEEGVRLLEETPGDEALNQLAAARSILMGAYSQLEMDSHVDHQLAEIRRLAERGLGEEQLKEAEIAGRMDGSNDEIRELATLDPDNAAEWRRIADLYDRMDAAASPAELMEVMIAELDPSDPVVQELHRTLELIGDKDPDSLSEEEREAVRASLARAAELRTEEPPPGAPWKAPGKLAELAVLDVVVGNRDRAVDRARRAIAEMETYLNRIGTHELAATMMDDEAQDPIRMAIWVLSRVDIEEAFEQAEKGRARALRLALSGGPRVATEPSEEQARLLGRISRLEAGESGSVRVEGEEGAELERLRDAYERVRFVNRLAAPTGPRVPRPPPDLETLQTEILSPDTTLVAFYAIRNQLLTWVVTTTGVEMIQRQMPSDELIAESIRGLRGRTSGCAGGRGESRGVEPLGPECVATAPAERLYEELIAPVEPWLRGRHLILLPTGALHEVPFAALRNPDSGRHLIEDYSLSLVPATSALAPPRSDASSAEGALVLGDSRTTRPPLAGARREATEISRLLGTRPLLGEDAAEGRIYEGASGSRVLHLATHGEYLPARPLFSRILLSPGGNEDGRLAVHEILDRLDLRGTELVVLSGCETALGEVSLGDDVVSLSSSFLLAGSRAVVSTLWRVDDDASAELMLNFYRGLLDGDTSPAQALRTAQLAALERPSTAAPYYWAGFSITGAVDSVLEPWE